MASHPSEPVLLSASNLESLNTSDESNRVEEFVGSQARYAKARVNEGRAVRASWGIGTPEKDKMRLHRDERPSAGFETPVLKPRTAQTQVEPRRPRPASPPLPRAPPSPKRDKKVKAKSVVVETISPKRQKRQNDRTAERQLRAPKSSRKRCCPRSDTDEEHVARLADRRERKREKREIMNPRGATAATRKERKDDATSGPTNKKKQKIPAGFALMHGFSSANVGKSRLTVEPPLNFGVFNKGRASEKVKVDERKRSKDKGGFPSRIFSEDRFLNSRLAAKQPSEHASGSERSEIMSSKSTSQGSSSLIKLKRSSAVQPRKTPIKMRRTINRQQPSINTQRDNEEMGSSARSRTGAELTPLAKQGKSRSSIQSASWAIEKDGCSLPSTSSEIAAISVKSKTETACLDVRTAHWGKFLKDNLLALSPLKTSKDPPKVSALPTTTTTRDITSKVPLEIDEPATIGPWESASQAAQSVLHPQEPISSYSRFFPLPQVDKSGSNEHTTHVAPKDINSAGSGSDVNPDLDEHSPASFDCRQLPRTTILSAPSATNDAPAFPTEWTSVLQPSSLDSVDRALLILDAPKVAILPYHRPRIRRRSIPRQEFNPTPEDMDLDQYGLEPIDSDCEVSLPLLHPDGREEIGTSGLLRNSNTLGTFRNTQHESLDFQEEYQVEESEMYGEEAAVRCYEDYPSTVLDSPESANDMVVYDTLPSSPYEHQTEASFFTNECDTNHERDIMDSISVGSTDFSAQPEPEDTRTNVLHLWDDAAAWPLARGELTNVQRVEQDVAKRLKGHWFPYKF